MKASDSSAKTEPNMNVELAPEITAAATHATCAAAAAGPAAFWP
jgi:hypothetical protein